MARRGTPIPTDGARQVLIVEENPFVGDLALRLLAGRGWRATAANSLDQAEGHRPDLVVLGCVEKVGGDLSPRLRRMFGVPVIPLLRPSLRVRGRQVQAGRSAPLLIALSDCRFRIEQHLRAAASPFGVAMRWGEFTLRLEPGSFALRGQDLGLTGAESAILCLLLGRSGEVVDNERIKKEIFRAARSQSNFVPVHISRIRTKLKAVRSDIFIENVRGEGYVLFWSRSLEPKAIPAFEVLEFDAVSRSWAGLKHVEP
ncbi:MAG: hypothetical protein DCF29_06390 [Alphaproteobacteria bacterium]|nr:MAG: hypothetical protein DCF29_06390 [Alphaproteobacteria bacterium]